MSIENYKNLILKLLPNGLAWNKDRTSNLSKLIEAAAVEFSRLGVRAEDVLKEADPRTSNELLPDWERFYGLPDECEQELDQTSNERRYKLLNRAITVRGGQSRQFFIDYIEALGFDVTITEFQQFRAGISAAGDALTNGQDWVNTWQINAPASLAYEFTAGSRAGEPLRVFRNDSIECSINHIKPAQTLVLFAYEEES